MHNTFHRLRIKHKQLSVVEQKNEAMAYAYCQCGTTMTLFDYHNKRKIVQYKYTSNSVLAHFTVFQFLLLYFNAQINIKSIYLLGQCIK